MAAYHRVDDLTVTCRLTACTPGSAPGPTLGIEYGKPLPFTFTIYLELDSMHWFSHRCRTGGRQLHYLLMPRPHPFVNFLHSELANRHILGCGDPGVGPMTPKLELGRHFCTMHLAVMFHCPTFNRSEVIVLTNKQTDAIEIIHLTLLCNAGG